MTAFSDRSTNLPHDVCGHREIAFDAILSCRGKLIPQEDELFVQSVTFRIRVPEVITLTEYGRVPTNAVTFSRRNIYKRDRFTCQYCGAQRAAKN